MPVRIKWTLINATIADDGIVAYNPNRVKLILTAQYPLTEVLNAMMIYRPPYTNVNEMQFFPLWGALIVAGQGATPQYLILDGEMAHGPWGVRNSSALTNYYIYMMEEIQPAAAQKETPYGLCARLLDMLRGK